jgi:hypothetical protein
MPDGVKLMNMKRKLPPEVLEYFKKQGAKGGKIGGKRRLDTIPPEKRSEIARKAAAARWKDKPAASGKAQAKRPRAKRTGKAE